MNKIPIKETLNMWFVIHIIIYLITGLYQCRVIIWWSPSLFSCIVMLYEDLMSTFLHAFFCFLRQMVYEVSFLLFAFYFSSLFAYRFVVEFLIQEHQQLFICLLMQEHCYLLFRLRSINPGVSLCLILWLYLKCVPLHSL